jgi:hypothetical protein
MGLVERNVLIRNVVIIVVCTWGRRMLRVTLSLRRLEVCLDQMVLHALQVAEGLACRSVLCAVLARNLEDVLVRSNVGRIAPTAERVRRKSLMPKCVVGP